MSAGPQTTALRLGIDLGGTKIAGIALAARRRHARRASRSRPRHDYAATIAAVAEMVRALEQTAHGTGSIGIGMPGSLSPASGLVQNANSTWLNGRPFQRDLESRLGRPVRARQRCQLLCAVGGRRRRGRRRALGVRRDPRHGLRRRARLRRRAHRRSARHRRRVGPQPPALGASPPSTRAPSVGAGGSGASRPGCPAPAWRRTTRRATGSRLSTEEIAARAAAGDAAAQATLDRHASRLARGLAHVVNIFDPEVIVLGGGLSKLAHLYAVLPGLVSPYVFAEQARAVVKPPVWGDAGGVRGAAWLWR